MDHPKTAGPKSFTIDFLTGAETPHMTNKTPFVLTREKHLDHMVRVVPLITLAYAIHSYLLLQMNSPLSQGSLFFLGVGLVLIVAGFITYDLKHRVILHEDRLEVSFLAGSKTILFQDIIKVEVSDKGHSFASLIIWHSQGKSVFYFLDSAQMAHDLILNAQTSLSEAA